MEAGWSQLCIIKNNKLSNMKTVKIQISNMQSRHCQMRVQNVLTTVEGVTINSIEPGVASITVENDLQQNEAMKAIEKAGYANEFINA